jgi:hypothetical protein
MSDDLNCAKACLSAKYEISLADSRRAYHFTKHECHVPTPAPTGNWLQFIMNKSYLIHILHNASNMMRFQIPIRVASINTSIEGNVDSYEHCLIECMQLRQCELPGNLCLELALHTGGYCLWRQPRYGWSQRFQPYRLWWLGTRGPSQKCRLWLVCCRWKHCCWPTVCWDSYGDVAGEHWSLCKHHVLLVHSFVCGKVHGEWIWFLDLLDPDNRQISNMNRSFRFGL